MVQRAFLLKNFFPTDVNTFFFYPFRFKITLTDHKIATHSSEARKTHYYQHKAILPAVKADNRGHIYKRNIMAHPRKHCYHLELPLSLC